MPRSKLTTVASLATLAILLACKVDDNPKVTVVGSGEDVAASYSAGIERAIESPTGARLKADVATAFQDVQRILQQLKVQDDALLRAAQEHHTTSDIVAGHFRQDFCQTRAFLERRLASARSILSTTPNEILERQMQPIMASADSVLFSTSQVVCEDR